MAAIAVGIDGSEHSHRALAWAVQEARLRGCGVLMIHSWTFPTATRGTDGLPHADLETAADKVLDEAVGSLTDASDVVIERQIANDMPAQALIRASEEADLVVVGSRGLGGFKGLLLGSVAQQVAHHARCTVAIVPHADRS